MHDFDSVKALMQSGLKNTKGRSAILDILAQSDHPLTAEQVFLHLRDKKVSANLSTVYRTLETFSEKKLAKKLDIPSSRAFYELDRLVHRHYLICRGCSKITAIESCPLAGYEKALEKDTNYSIEGHCLNIYGYCPECRQQKEKK